MIKAVILAGGQSSRMGENKALLPFKGKRLIDHMVKIAEQASGRRVIVSGQYSEFDCVPDNNKNKGPLSGVEACLKQEINNSSHLIIIPVDMPYLNVDILETLIQKAGEAEIVYYKNYPLPILLEVNEKAYKTVNSLINNTHPKNRSIKQLLNQFNTLQLDVEGIEQHFINTNTPKQWQHFLEGSHL